MESGGDRGQLVFGFARSVLAIPGKVNGKYA